jgi:cell division protein FtsN
MSLSKSPSPLPQKETREKSSPGPSKELKLPPPLPAPLDTPMVQEEPSNKAPPPAPTVVGRAAPSVPLAKEPKPETLEQLALKKAPVNPQLVKPKPEALRDYIVQFSFPERAEAERWAGLLKEEGYATVISVGGDGRPVRLRVGNFPSSTEAKSALSRLQKKGLTGLVVQLPN